MTTRQTKIPKRAHLPRRNRRGDHHSRCANRFGTENFGRGRNQINAKTMRIIRKRETKTENQNLRNKRAGEAEEDERAYDKVVNTYTGEENPKREIEREI